MTITHKLVSTAILLCLVACGGGGNGGTNNIDSIANQIELQGTWIYSSDAHFTGNQCGVDPQGNYGERQTLVFTASSFTFKKEICLILQGNTGGYFQSDSVTGNFVTGDIYVSSNDPSSVMTEINLEGPSTVYTSFNITNNKLKIGYPFGASTGESPDNRAFQTASFYDAALRKLIRPPTFTKL